MKAKRKAPPRRGSDRRRHDTASHLTSRRPADFAPSRSRPRAGKPSAPTREPRMSRSAPRTAPIPRPAERVARPSNSSQAKARAKARKAKAPKIIRPKLRERVLRRLVSIDLRPRALASKVPFVVLVIVSLAAGLGATLWLSTDAAERSYELGSARLKNQILQQRKESLERDVLGAQAAPALAEAARGLGMIPTKDTAHLIQDPAGNWVVVGTPRPAEGAPPPPLNTKLADEKPAPAARPPLNSVEVPILVSPGLGAPIGPGVPQQEVVVGGPDDASILNPHDPPVQHAPFAPGLPAAGPVSGESFSPVIVAPPWAGR